MVPDPSDALIRYFMHLKPSHWYWIRRRDGSLAPYLFHRYVESAKDEKREGEFYVGSMLQKWPLSAVVGEAKMPKDD